MPNKLHPLITATAVAQRLASGLPTVVLDCSFDLMDAHLGERAFETAHVPGAQYAHLERDLSGPKSAQGSVHGGRHPLPDRGQLAARMGAWGIAPETLVVAYDAQGAAYAARAWWLLRWMGHTQAAVLDGGLAAWQQAGGAMASGPSPTAPPQPAYPATGPAMPTVNASDLLTPQGRQIVIDARAPERYRGEVEPLDAQAGHIPGARNRFFKDNLAPDGRFLSADTLRAVFAAYGVAPNEIVHQCGSGVTACQNLLAMAVAGMHGAKLYPGSWSEWSADSTRPVARG
ncbi:MAG: sulfurtransferase [Vitreoscilla sp.]|nr:sulfurtransferase [Vitreoscilla sp.]